MTELLRFSISELALAHNQMVLSTTEGVVLLSWGGKLAFNEQELTKIEIRNNRHRFSYAFELHKVKGIPDK